MPSEDNKATDYTSPLSDDVLAESEQKKDGVNTFSHEKESASCSGKIIVLSDEGVYCLPLKLKLMYYG